MSKLNAGAFEFVPGRAFVLPQKSQTPPSKPPLERPLQTEAPPPAPTITLNIGGSNPLTAPKPAPAPALAPTTTTQQSKPALPPSVSASTAPSQSSSPAPPTNKVFSTERAKTDTTSIAKEVQAVADQEVLKDLFGDGAHRTSLSFSQANVLIYSQSKNILTSSSSAM
jgi:peptide chain release factor subunit 3